MAAAVPTCSTLGTPRLATRGGGGGGGGGGGRDLVSLGFTTSLSSGIAASTGCKLRENGAEDYSVRWKGNGAGERHVSNSSVCSSSSNSATQRYITMRERRGRMASLSAMPRKHDLSSLGGEGRDHHHHHHHPLHPRPQPHHHDILSLTNEVNIHVSVRASSSAAGSDGVATVGNKPEDAMTSVMGGGEEEAGLKICRIVNGMWQTSGGWGKIEPEKAVDAMFRHVDNGLTTFDMADHYGPAEDLYGMFRNRALREKGEEYASKIQGLTKWCPSPGKMTRGVVEDNIDRSRKRMGVKTLDMLQFHWWDYSNAGYLDALKHMQDLKEEGKITTLSLTNFDTKRLQIILENGIKIGSNQVQYSLVDKRPAMQMSELCELTGVKLITYGTVLGGLMSEKFLDKPQPGSWGGPALNTPSLNKYKRMIDAWGGWALFQELLRSVNRVARKHGVPIAAVGLRYVLDQSAVGGSMVGVRLGIYEHIQDSKKVFSFQLDQEDKERIETVTDKGRNLMAVIGDCGDEYRG